jgi:phosphate transport system protein
MQRHFDEELNILRERILHMGSLAELMTHLAVQSLKERDEAIANEVFIHEDEVNSLHIEIDDMCLKLLALRQPIATDLRFITSAIRINSDLERIGDQAVNISQSSLRLIQKPQLKPLIDIPRMATVAKDMVRDSLDAFVRKDTELAKLVLLKDDEVDDLKDQIFRELLTYMVSDSTTIPRALELILISRHLERIADHATNIAEDVIFMVKGKEIRHHAEEKK